MIANALLSATLLVGQAPPLEQPPVYSAGPAAEYPQPSMNRQPYEAASESPQSGVVVAGLGVPAPTSPAPRMAEDQPAPAYGYGSSRPLMASPAPLAMPGNAEAADPRGSWDPPSSRARTIHTVEPGTMAATQPAPSSNLANALLDRALAPPRERALHGRPLTLTEAFTGTSPSRSDVVRKYWDCTMKMAEYHSSLDEYARLLSLPAPQAGDARGVLAAAQAAVKARADEAELDAVSAQYDLAETLKSAYGAEPPLPTETPLVAAYRTQFDAIFADRNAPGGLKQIHETLPLLHRALHSRAEAVVAAEDAASTQEDAYRRGSVELSQVLAMQQAVRLQRRAFFDAVLEYNTRIGKYAVAVAGTESPNTLATTLVENPALSASSAARSVLVRNSPGTTTRVTAEPLVVTDPSGSPPAWQNREVTVPTVRAPAREAQIPGFDGGRWK